MQLISSQCRSRGNLGAKIFEGMFAAMPSYASNAAAAVCSLNHAPCMEITTRYLAAFLNDMTRSSGLVQELIDSNQKHLKVRISTTLAAIGGDWQQSKAPTSENVRHIKCSGVPALRA